MGCGSILDNCVSVIIPNYNGAATIESAITSCLKQGSFLREIIVIDDFSTDNSKEIVNTLKSKFPEKVKLYKNIEKGGNIARNYGFSKSSGHFIQWLDADDVLLGDKFRIQLQGFQKNSTADVIYSDWYMDIYDGFNKLKERTEKTKSQYKDFLYEILADNWSVPANYLFRRELAERLNEGRGWNPDTKVAQDREYVTLAALNGASFVYVPGFFSIYNRFSVSSVSKMNFKCRLGFQLEMEEKFRKTILRAVNISRRRKARYISVLNSHIINAIYYAPNLQIRHPFSIFHVDWKIVHYKKYPIVPFIYILKHLSYFRRRYITRCSNKSESDK